MPEEFTRRVVVRPAQRRDTPRCADIFLEGRRETSSGQGSDLFQWHDYLDCVAGEEVWVADLGGQVVGFASLDRNEHTLRHLFVDAAWRSRGVGERLMEEVLRGLSGEVSLRCAARNVRARAFYERTGWEAVPSQAASGGEFILFRRAAYPVPL